MPRLFFQVVIWKSIDESDKSVYATNVPDFSFDTVLPGGFGSATFTLPDTDLIKSNLISSFGGHHLVVFDSFNHRVYEGRIVSIDTSATSISLSVEGYYAAASDLTHGIIYPISTPKSISAIIKDSVDLVTNWSTDKSGIITTTQDITPQDFTGEKKIKDAIEEVLKYGSDDTVPVPLHFAIWENRKAFLFKQLKPGVDKPKWSVKRHNFVDQAGLAMNVSRSSIYNKIQVLYDDPYIGQTFIDPWFEDAVSQALYGVREGTVNIGASTSTLATLVGELYIASYSKPFYTARVGLQGLIKSNSGLEFPYMLRAGELLSLTDYDYNIVFPDIGNKGFYYGVQMISRTSYNSSSNTVSVEMSTNNVALDILLARLGMSSSSIS